MSSFFLYLYVTAIGFAVAGLFGSAIQLFTGEPLRFSFDYSVGIFWVIVGIITRVLAGPFILVRNSIRGRIIEKRSLGWLAASAAISMTWSFMSGVFILETFLSITNSI